MRKSRLSKDKQHRLKEHFMVGSMARMAAALVGMNKNMAAYHYHRLREIIYQVTEDATPFAEEIEVDKSYSGGNSRAFAGAELQVRACLAMSGFM